MIRVCALTNGIAGRHQEMFLALERSLQRKNVPFYLFLESGEWKWKRKVQWELEETSKHPDDLFVFIDAWDVLFVGELDELEQVLLSSPMIFSCDAGRVPWPEPYLVDDYDKRRKKLSPWCWVNGSGPAGRGSVIAEAAAFGLARYPWLPGETDQTFWTRVYLAGYGELDQMCNLTQALYDSSQPKPWVTPHLGYKDGRIVNMLTLAKPQFIHATGHSWSVIPKELIP